MFITNNHASFHVWWKRNSVNSKKCKYKMCSSITQNWVSFLMFVSPFLNIGFLQNFHIYRSVEEIFHIWTQWSNNLFSVKLENYEKNIPILIQITLLTHFMPLVSFDTPWKYWCFQGASKETSGMERVKRCIIFHSAAIEI